MNDYDFLNTDAEVIYNDIIGNLMFNCDEPLYPGDERRIFGEALVALGVGWYSEFNDKAKQRFLRFARGNKLDAIAEMLGVTRLEPEAAYATFRFTLSATRAESVIINAGTRITTDGSVYFATDTTAVIQPSEIGVDVRATCMETGSGHNGYASGSVTTLVDLIPYVEAVYNIEATKGGDDGEPYTDDGDGRFRERIRLAPAQFTTAGTESSYRYYALSADPDIIDVKVVSPSATVINIYPLMVGGKLPDDMILKAVEASCGAADVRPMTDLVTAMPPSTVGYDIKLHYYVSQENESDVIAVVEGEGGAIDQYNEWQQSAIGRDINPDYLRKLLLVPGSGITGVDRVDIISPSFLAVGDTSVAQFSGTITVTHEVI